MQEPPNKQQQQQCNSPKRLQPISQASWLMTSVLLILGTFALPESFKQHGEAMCSVTLPTAVCATT